MTNAFIDFFKEPPFKETIRDEQKVKDMYTHFRWRIFYSSFIAYVVFHLCRKNIDDYNGKVFIGYDIRDIMINIVMEKVMKNIQEEN